MLNSEDGAELLRIYRDACARLHAGDLTAGAVAAVPPGAAVLALGKVAHVQMRSVLAARPDLRPLLSISTTSGPEAWALAGDHPVPGEASFTAGACLLDLAAAHDGQPLVLLLSGGGSALAAAPAPGIDPDEKIAVTKLLLTSGLDIQKMNTVRKRLSALKGGGLARAAPHSEWWVFAMSDVVGDDLGTIASGPCSPERGHPRAAERICREAGLWNRLPYRVQRRLAEPPDPPFDEQRIHAEVLAGARTLARIAEAESPWPATVLAPVTDSVEALASRYAAWTRDRIGLGPALLIATGEPTLRVTGTGRGGRCQHLALLMAAELRGLDACFLAAGTDGRDGDTLHAGAIVDGGTAELAGLDLAEAIAGFDSAPLHAALETAIPAWQPCTHLGELHLLLVR